MSTSARSRRRYPWSLLLVLALPATVVAAPASATPIDHGATGKVTLCHATHAVTNPYVIITIDPAAIFRQGHDLHHWRHPNGTTLRTPRTFFQVDSPSAQNDWDDVIPAFYYTTAQDPVPAFYPGLNWPADGPIWNEDREGALALLEELCFGEPITPEGFLLVEKDAAASFERTHAWDIDKSVDEDEVRLVVGDSATIEYTIEAKYLGYEDHSPTVSGSITISNGGDLDARIDSVDDFPGSGTAEVDCGVTFPYVLVQGDELECTYTGELEEIEDGTNVVIVEGYFLDDEGDEVEAFAFDDDADYEFGDPADEHRVEVEVTDESDLLGFQSFGTLHAYDDFDGVPGSEFFSYDHTFDWEDHADECEDSPLQFDNTATVTDVETDEVLAEDDESVTVDVQCLVFKDETVTGAGRQWSALQGAPNTWFEYSPKGMTNRNHGFDGNGKADLIQGRPRNVVGDVTLNGTQLCFSLGEFGGYQWELDASTNNVKVLPLASQPTRYVQPGKFTTKATRSGSSFCVAVPPATYGYAIHLDAGYWMPDPSF
jgi:hypothetical protein